MDVVHTSLIEDPVDLVNLLPCHRAISCWVRFGKGIVGSGIAHAGSFPSAAAAEAWWLELVSTAKVTNVFDEPMAGPVAFISFPFTPDGSYEVVVPEVVIGSRNGQSWITTWNHAELAARKGTPSPLPEMQFRTGNFDHDQWISVVNQIITRIHHHSVDKVVLARDEIAETPSPIDVCSVLTHLAAAYPQTWTFCVNNLVGASPELLIRQDRGLITSRVLAGTIHGDHDESSLAEALKSSSKDLREHEYAVASVANALRPHVTSLHVPEVPFVLQLPNVMHLASDISGAVRPGATVLELASTIHPSAAVCGTPTALAREVITELENMDRGRYAGPVGWINAEGDGEIALALRCGMIEEKHVRIFAGCGIVADSNPEAEWAETQAKLLPMKQALGVL